jgi:DNA-binding winged helix-turn-helix (wHTH) protein/TolB-like protein/Flp pilus assembly protein TadD
VQRHSYEFGPFRLDANERLLVRDGEVVPLTPKAVDLLVVLAENNGHVISKSELMKLVWPDSFVEEANLSHNIFILRKALGEEKSGVKYIETIPRRGYRFVASVTETHEDGDELVVAEHSRSHIIVEQSETLQETTAESAGQRDVAKLRNANVAAGGVINKRWALVALACSAAAIGVAMYFWATAGSRYDRSVASVKSMAILPFKLINTDAGDDYLGIGLADSLIVRFGKLKQIVVRPTNAVAKYNVLGQDPLPAGRELKVDAVLDGTIQKFGDRIRVSVQLIRVVDGTHLWTDRFEEKSTDLFAVQDRVSEKVGMALSPKLTGEEQKQLTRRYTDNSEAYRLYLKGGYHWNKWTPEDWQKAVDYFNQAIEKDPNYAQAYGWLGAAYQVQGNNGVLPPKEANAKAKQFAQRALQIDDDLDQGHYTMGAVNLFYEWDWPGAERELKRAVELNPNYVEGRILYVYYLMVTGHTDESLSEARRCEELNPVSPFVSMNLADMLSISRRYDEAIVQYRKTLELDPHYPGIRFALSGSYLEKGMTEQAVAEVNKGLELCGCNKETSLELAYVYARINRQAEAQAILDRLKKGSKENQNDPMQMCYLYAALGQKDRAFEWLERAYDEPNSSLIWVAVEPRLDNLRSDPRFAAVQRRIGLAQ